LVIKKPPYPCACMSPRILLIVGSSVFSLAVDGLSPMSMAGGFFTSQMRHRTNLYALSSLKIAFAPMPISPSGPGQFSGRSKRFAIAKLPSIYFILNVSDNPTSAPYPSPQRLGDGFVWPSNSLPVRYVEEGTPHNKTVLQ